MFSHNESYLREPLKKPLLDVYKEIMKYETIFEKIEAANPDVKAYEVEPEYAERRSLRSLKANNIDELVLSVKDIESMPGNKFILAYCDCPDSILHKFGTTSEDAKTFILETERKIEDMCNSFDEDTIVIISADHGHKNIENAYTLLDYPEIQECLIMPAYLESRVLTFWVKDNMRNEFVERFNKIFENEFWLMTKEEFLDKYHFLGYGEKHPKIDDFIGNYMALSTSSGMIRLETFLAEGKPIKKSTHCGLSKEEMEVPVFVIKK